MQGTPRLRFPEGSLLSAMLGEHAPVDVRRAAWRLRAEAAPAVAIDGDLAELARGLAFSDVSRSPAVLDVLPPLFWLETRRVDGGGIHEIGGWIVEKKRGGLAARGFSVALGPEAVPEPAGTATVSFGAVAEHDDEETRCLRGLVTVVGLPEMMAQMGESSPVRLLPADESDRTSKVLRGFRLSVAVLPNAALI